MVELILWIVPILIAARIIFMISKGSIFPVKSYGLKRNRGAGRRNPAAFVGWKAPAVSSTTLSDLQPRFEGRAVLIAGAGQLGRELARQLHLCSARDVVLYDPSESTLSEAVNYIDKEGIFSGTFVIGSILDYNRLKKVLLDFDIDIIFHTASLYHFSQQESNPTVALNTNVVGTNTLCRVSVEVGIDKFIYVSSPRVHDRSVTSIGTVSRRMAEAIVAGYWRKAHKTVFSTVRVNTLDGERSLIDLVSAQVAAGGPVTITHPHLERRFLSVQEASLLLLSAASISKGGETFVFDIGAKRVLDIVKSMVNMMGHSISRLDDPDGDIDLVFTGLRPGENIEEAYPSLSEMTATEIPEIFVAKSEERSEFEIAKLIQDISNLASSNDEAGARALVAKWVDKNDLRGIADVAT